MSAIAVSLPLVSSSSNLFESKRFSGVLDSMKVDVILLDGVYMVRLPDKKAMEPALPSSSKWYLAKFFTEDDNCEENPIYISIRPYSNIVNVMATV